MAVILASEIRRKMLVDAGVLVDVQAAKIDENSIKQSLIAEKATHNDIVDTLAEMKAQRIALKNPNSIVIGCDQILVCDGQLYDKSETVKEAETVLRSLRGKSHTLLSAAVIYQDAKPVWRHIGRAQLIMRMFSDEFLQTYLEENTEALTNSVGCYHL